MPNSKELKVGLVANVKDFSRDVGGALKKVGLQVKEIGKAFNSAFQLRDLQALGPLGRTLTEVTQRVERASGSFGKMGAGVRLSSKALAAETELLEDYQEQLQHTTRQLGQLEATRKKFGGFTTKAHNSEYALAKENQSVMQAGVDRQESILGAGSGGSALLKSFVVGTIVAVVAKQTLAYMKTLPDQYLRQNQFEVQSQARAGALSGMLGLRPGAGDMSGLIGLQQILQDPKKTQSLSKLADENSMGYHLKNLLGEGMIINPLGGNFFPWTEEQIKRRAAGRHALASEEITQNVNAQSGTFEGQKEILAYQLQQGQGPLQIQSMRSLGMNESQMKDFLDSTNKQTSAGGGRRFSNPEMLQMAGGIASSGGGAAAGLKLAGDALNVTIKGMDPSVVSAISGGLAAGGSASALLKHLSSVAGTSMDVFAAQRAGSFVSENYQTGNGINTGAGLMSAMTGGYGPDKSTHAYKLSMRQEALGGITGILGGPGSDPYQHSKAIQHALEIARGSDKLGMLGVERLSNLTTEELFERIESGPSEYDKHLGIAKGDYLKMLNKQLDELPVRVLRGGNNPTDKLLSRTDREKFSGLIHNGNGEDDVDIANILVGSGFLKKPEAAMQGIQSIRQADQGLRSDGAPGAGKDEGSHATDLLRIRLNQEGDLFLHAQTSYRKAILELARATMGVVDSVDMVQKKTKQYIHNYYSPLPELPPERPTASPRNRESYR